MKWEDLFLNGSLIDLDISFWRGQRKLVADDLGLDLGPAAERVFSLGRKRLIPKEKMQTFQRVEHTARKAVDEASLPFPLADLMGVNPVLTGQFVERMLPFGCFKGQTKFKIGTVLTAFLGHKVSPPER